MNFHAVIAVQNNGKKTSTRAANIHENTINHVCLQYVKSIGRLQTQLNEICKIT